MHKSAQDKYSRHREFDITSHRSTSGHGTAVSVVIWKYSVCSPSGPAERGHCILSDQHESGFKYFDLRGGSL